LILKPKLLVKYRTGKENRATSVTFSYTYYQFIKIKTTIISKTDEDLGIVIKTP